MSMRFYIWGDGRVWRIPHAVVREAANLEEEGRDGYDYLIQHTRMLSARHRGGNRWTKLPKGIGHGYEEDDPRLESETPEVEIVHYDDIMETLPYWRDRFLLRRPGWWDRWPAFGLQGEV